MAKPRLAAALSSVLFLVFLFGALIAPSTAASSEELLNAVKTVAAQTDKLRSMMADLNQSQFKIVDVATVLSSSDESAFRAALKKNASDIADMRDTLNHTTMTGNDGVVMSAAKLLQGQEVKISQVVAISVSGNSITIYYQ
ncbi:MAG TPA: hypothetical protein VGZ02_00500 [Candidatus Baltobacteraceae bacterium]|jgi:predicted PurR-regulated permease PerM|nr:hypothetical protein [Candidatus Baltobacteraceae bacterium]